MNPETVVITIEYLESGDPEYAGDVRCKATCEDCKYAGYGDTEWEAIADLAKAMIGYKAE